MSPSATRRSVHSSSFARHLALMPCASGVNIPGGWRVPGHPEQKAFFKGAPAALRHACRPSKEKMLSSRYPALSRAAARHGLGYVRATLFRAIRRWINADSAGSISLSELYWTIFCRRLRRLDLRGTDGFSPNSETYAALLIVAYSPILTL